MADLENPHLLYCKGFLFVVLGSLAVGLILLEHPSLRLALLLGVAIWAFCRAYYFAFYVIQHYIDPSDRYAGLFDFLRRRTSARSGPPSLLRGKGPGRG